MASGCQVTVRFFEPPSQLRRYFTTFYFAEWQVADGGRVTDYLLPEWANLRFIDGDCPDVEIEAGMVLTGTRFPVTGPSCRAVKFTVGSARQWGLGLLPLGWAKFVGLPAESLANAVIDGNQHAAFAAFRPLAQGLFGRLPDTASELARITAYFLQRIDDPAPDLERIHAVHAALVDPDANTVGDLVERSGISQRTLERICRRSFGFSPKLLLRRQRFVRSLTHFMLDPSLKWIGAIDSHYHDQAQFVRDFHQFMGMTPRQYAALPKPLLSAVMKAREQLAGSAAQTLDGPDGSRIRA